MNIYIQPKDPSKKHFYVSIVKSAVRMAAAFTFMSVGFVTAGILLFLAELLGILEELV